MRSFRATNISQFSDFYDITSRYKHGTEQAVWNLGVLWNDRPLFDEGRGEGRTTKTDDVDIAKDTR